MPATKETFAPYLNRYFVETGSYEGRGIEAALAAGFENVISIELADKWYEFCLDKFKDNPRVTLVHGESEKKLAEVIRDINEPITFWLDAHKTGGGKTAGKSKHFCPVIQEVETIRQHPIKTHTILFDDLRHLGSKSFDYVTEEQIREAILKVNPKYEFSYEDGYHAPSDTRFENDILVARVPA